MGREKQQPSPLPMAAAAAILSVLNNDDLLGEILLHLDFPTCLVCAALVCKRWLRLASDPSFLRRFGVLHPPRLLGFYIVSDGVPRPHFMAAPQPLELAPAVHYDSFSFDDTAEYTSSILDCRNGRLLINFNDTFAQGPTIYGVRNPLHPERGTAFLPPPPPTCVHWSGASDYMFLSDDGGDGLSYFRVDLVRRRQNVSVQVHALQAGVWDAPIFGATKLPVSLGRTPRIGLLVRGKLYMVTTARYILGLDLASASFFTIDLPDEVGYEYDRNLVLARAEDSGIYLIHVIGFQLSIWHVNGDGSDDMWVQVVNISVFETCREFAEPFWEPDEEPDAVAIVVGVGDNAEFVFLELVASGAVVYMHVGSRAVEKVYEREPDNDDVIAVYPFMTPWPPIFRALDEGHE